MRLLSRNAAPRLPSRGCRSSLNSLQRSGGAAGHRIEVSKCVQSPNFIGCVVVYAPNDRIARCGVVRWACPTSVTSIPGMFYYCGDCAVTGRSLSCTLLCR